MLVGPFVPVDPGYPGGPSQAQLTAAAALLQGVGINDKHIEAIARQMMQKVLVTDPGDTTLLEGDMVDRFVMEDYNNDLFDKFVVMDKGDSDLYIGQVVDNRALREVNSGVYAFDTAFLLGAIDRLREAGQQRRLGERNILDLSPEIDL